MAAALVWLIVGLALIVAEVVSGAFVLVMLGVGALFGAGSAALGGNVFVDVAAFGLSSVGLLFGARPALRRRFLAGPGVKTNSEALIGARAVVLSTVDVADGRVKVAGDIWSARSMYEGESIEPGTSVTIVEISGATVVVSAEF
jgi:membrane protein implicated in regulation of membrane protease activity